MKREHVPQWLIWVTFVLAFIGLATVIDKGSHLLGLAGPACAPSDYAAGAYGCTRLGTNEY